MSIATEAKSWIRAGQDGQNTGLDMGLPKLMRVVPGFQKATTYSLGGESGSGKSKLAAQLFIYAPYEHLKAEGRADKLRVLLFSLEIEKRQVLINAAINRLYRQYNILLDVNYVLSRGENRCSAEHYQLVCEQLDFWEELEDCLIIHDTSQGPTGINKTVLKYFADNGTIHKRVVDNGDGPREIWDRYEPRDGEVLVSPQVDHIGLLRGEASSPSKKALIDKLSTEYAIPWRNFFKASPVFVQQLNRTLSSTDRAKIDRVRPQLSDFKESSTPQEDANVVLALFSPNRYQISDYEGYKVSLMKDRFRSLHVLKNRDGQADKIIGTKFIGECGNFTELPKPADIGVMGNTTYEQLLRN